MYNLKCVENGNMIDSLKTENVKEIEKFFNRNRYFSGLTNKIIMIKNMKISESFKFYKNKDINKYIEVTILI